MGSDLFISYAHSDNARQQVRELRDEIVMNFREFAGRELSVFFDETSIPSMADWERKIATGLRESQLFLAVLSPGFFASPFCRREVAEYVRYEAMRHCLGDGIAPIYFVELPGLGNPQIEEKVTALTGRHRKPQICDLRPWYDAGKRALEDAYVAERLQSLRGEINERLSRAARSAQSPTNVYRHNPQFVGRVRELSALREAINERGSIGVVGEGPDPVSATTVHGLGGMGKTELVLAYAHAFAWDYPGGRWLVRCEGVGDFDLALRQLAEPMNVVLDDRENAEPSRAAERILAELRRRDRSLLLLDNVTKPELLGPHVLMRLPPQGHVHVLATTRFGPSQIAGSPHDHVFISVDELPEDDAIALIRAHQPEMRFAAPEDEAAAHDLVALLGCFTLAVETAAIYLGRHSSAGAIHAYLERLLPHAAARSDAEAADPAVAVRHRDKLLATTLAITFDGLSDEQLRVLTLAAMLPPDLVPLPWLRSVAEQCDSSFDPSGGHVADTSWQALAQDLISLRLLQQSGADTRIVRMHRLVQELLRTRMAAGEAQAKEQLLEFVLTRAAAIQREWANESCRWELDPLLACARKYMADGERIAIVIAGCLSLPLQKLGRWPEKERLIREAVDVATELLEPSDPVLATLQSNLAQVLSAMNCPQEAEGLILKALAIDTQAFGPRHPKVGIRLNNLAGLLSEAGRLQDAELMYGRAMAILERSYSRDHPDVLACISNRGQVLLRMNRLDEAEPLIREALALQEASAEPDHPELAMRLWNLGSWLSARGRLTEATACARRSLDILRCRFGPFHPQVSLQMSNLASLLHQDGQIAEAESLARKALEVAETAFPPGHPTMAAELSTLASILLDTNRAQEAEPLMRRALAISEENLASNHTDIAVYLNNLAQLLQRAGRWAEAEALTTRHLTIFRNFERQTGRQHRHWHEAVGNYRNLLSQQGLDESEIETRLRGLE